MKGLHLADRWYGRLLLVYPSAYRARFGNEMRQTFRDVYRDHGGAAYLDLPFWMHMVCDVSVGAARQYGELIGSERNMFQLVKKSRPLQFLVVAVVVMAATAGFQVFTLRTAHSSLGNYAAFRGCESIIRTAPASASCSGQNGKTITLVEFRDRWYLKDDLPECWHVVCL
jgi:hypothetical protein